MSKLRDDNDLWVYRDSGKDDFQRRLFCLPYAGGGAAVYRRWPGAVPSDIEICRIQLPGRESRLRERPFDRMAPLIERLLIAVGPLLDRPFAIFGHSMGALVGFELARAVRREFGKSADRLFASGWRAPQLLLGGSLHALPETAFLEKLQARFSGIPAAVLNDREILEMMLPTLRADLAVCESYDYVADSPFDFPITVFGGYDDHWVNPTELAAWATHTEYPLDVEMFPGGHFFINDQFEIVTQQVAARLAPATRAVRAQA